MKKKGIVPRIALALILTSFWTFAFNVRRAEARTIVVPRDYQKIQDAVNAAVGGDTIFVQAGTYNEGVVIFNKSISLIGEGAGNTTINAVFTGA
jgi:pectin methylesterase-like acyl-CoA thioesterase